MSNNLKKIKNFSIFVLGLIIPILFLFFSPNTKFGENIDYSWLDLLYTARGNIHPNNKVVIVAIDEPSFQEIKKQWPWPRSYHAKLIKQLKEAGAKAIAFDIMFVEPSKFPGDDEKFAKAIKDAGNVVLGASISQVQRQGYSQTIFVQPIDNLVNAAKSIALVNFFPDADGIIRHGRLIINNMPTLSFAAALISFNQKTVNKWLNKDLDSLQPFLINFAGQSGSVKTVSYYQVLDRKKYLPENFFKDKIVFVGFASDAAVEVTRSAVDSFPTPFFRFSRKAMFGVEIHANTLSTILEGLPLKEIQYPFLNIIFAIIISIPVFFRKFPLKLAFYVIGVIVLLMCCSLYLFIYRGIAIYMGIPIVALTISGVEWGLAGFFTTYREKKKIRGAFDRYVPPAVVEEVLKNPDLLNLGGEKRNLTVLFSDIRGFTSLSEKTSPEKLIYCLNYYLGKMTDKVFYYNGLLDKYIGDAVMAVYGAPIPRDDHADMACVTALEMIDALKEVGEFWQNEGLDKPRIGIGINSGDMVVGNIGSYKHFDYTVIGDEVNLASRLEGLTKEYGASIIIGENTKNLLKRKYVVRELDLVKVKGKLKPVKIYHLIKQGEIEHELKLLFEDFYEGLYFYREGSWEKALKVFENILKTYPNDKPTQLFLNRCEILIKNKIEYWDGTWTMTTK